MPAENLNDQEYTEARRPVTGNLWARLCLPLAAALLLSACTGVPDGIEPVRGFDLDRYLGTWYEIARLDHPFERGLDRVTATYSLRPDGGVHVTNRGFSKEKNAFVEAEGVAYMVGKQDVAHLRVSFFRPFYSAYIVFGLDREDYRYAFVAGYNHDYLWLLARSPSVDDAVIERFLATSKAAGFNTGNLIYVPQEISPEAAANEIAIESDKKE